MTFLPRILSLPALMLALSAAPASAQFDIFPVPGAGGRAAAPEVGASLVAGQTAWVPGRPAEVALKLEHPAHWHTYWLNPGLGTPTTLKWELPPGWQASGKFLWPVPEVKPTEVGNQHLYEGTRWLFTTVTPPADLKPGETVTLKASAKWLVCDEGSRCMPGGASLEISLPSAAEAAPVPAVMAELEKVRAQQPVVSPAWEVKLDPGWTVTLTPRGGANPDPGEIYFFDEKASISNDPQKVTREGNVIRITAKPAEGAKGDPLGFVHASKGWLQDGSVPALAVPAAAAAPVSPAAVPASPSPEPAAAVPGTPAAAPPATPAAVAAAEPVPAPTAPPASVPDAPASRGAPAVPSAEPGPASAAPAPAPAAVPAPAPAAAPAAELPPAPSAVPAPAPAPPVPAPAAAVPAPPVAPAAAAPVPAPAPAPEAPAAAPASPAVPAAPPAEPVPAAVPAGDAAAAPASAAAPAVAAPAPPPPAPAAAPAGAGGQSGKVTFWGAVLGLFLAGMVLNLMPCVFPVLALKVQSFIRQAGKDQRHTVNHSLAYTAGLLVFVWLVAGGMFVANRSFGHELAWGDITRYTPVLAGVVMVLFLLGLNLAGLFEIGTSLTAVGGELQDKKGYAGSFWSGALTLLISTPCSAPLMAAPMGFALKQDALNQFVLFTSFGLGIALPYVVLANSPALLKKLPKPGAWMETFKKALSFPMFAAAIFFLNAFVTKTGGEGAALMLWALLLTAIGGWIYGHWCPPGRSPRSRWTGGLAALLAVAGGVELARQASLEKVSSSGEVVHMTGDLAWTRWSPETLAAERAKGKAVFVDYTTINCYLCEVNERRVFKSAGSDAVTAKFKTLNVTPLRAKYLADGTPADNAIRDSLKPWGISTYPAYIMYPADASKAPFLVSSDVLSQTDVIEALEKAVK